MPPQCGGRPGRVRRDGGLETIRATLTLTTLIVLLLAGCGTDQVKVDNAYVAATDPAVQSFETRFRQLQDDFTARSTPVQDRETLTTLRRSVDRTVAALRTITPPKRIARLHARLVREIQSYGAIVDAVRKGFRSDDPRRVIAARARFSTRVDAAAAKLSVTVGRINAALQ